MLSNNYFPTIVAIIEDRKTSTFSAKIKIAIPVRRGAVRETFIEVPKSLLGLPSKFMARLRDAGAILPQSCDCRTFLNNICASEETAECLKRAKALGWRRKGRDFISFWGSTGKGALKGRTLPPVSQLYEEACSIGTAKRWRNGVAKSAAFSSIAVLSICTAFSAATLRFVEINSFALMIVGRSKGGKSTAQLAGASVIGFAKEENLPNFNRTDAALAELLAAFNDHPLYLNEFELFKGSPSERNEVLRSLAYFIGEGRGKSFAASTGRPSARFRTVLLGSAEEGPASGTSAKLSGANARLLFVPASGEADGDIFDLALPSLSSVALEKWKIRKFVRIRKACKRNAGRTYTLFTRRIAEDPKAAGAFLVQRSEKMLAQLTSQGDDPVVRHAARYFAHIAASGMLAAHLNLLPYDDGLIIEAVKKCFRRTVDTLPTRENRLRESLDRFKCFMRTNGVRREFVTEKTALYWERRDRNRVVTVRGADLIRELGGAELATEFLQAADSAGLVLSGSRKTKSMRRVVEFESQITWPSGGRIRSVQIVWKPKTIMTKARATVLGSLT